MKDSRDSLSFELTQSKSKIIEKLEERIKDNKSGSGGIFASELSSNYIHYSNFKIEEDRIRVHRYRAAPIYIYLEEIPAGKTRVRIEQEKLASRAKIVLAFFSLIMFAIVFYYNLTFGHDSIGSAILLTMIPLVIWVLILAIIFYLLGELQKSFFRSFANKIVRHLGQD